MGEFSLPLFVRPLFSFFLIPQILISCITLLQKFTPHFKILDPRLLQLLLEKAAPAAAVSRNVFPALGIDFQGFQKPIRPMSKISLST